VATTKGFLRDSNGDPLDHAAHSRDKIPPKKPKIIQKNSVFIVAFFWHLNRPQIGRAGRVKGSDRSSNPARMGPQASFSRLCKYVTLI
jgi:hypothetical protein